MSTPILNCSYDLEQTLQSEYVLNPTIPVTYTHEDEEILVLDRTERPSVSLYL